MKALDAAPGVSVPAAWASQAQGEPSRAAPLAQLQSQLAAARAELQDFTYHLAHDLRAPLRHINAYSKLLAADLPDLGAEQASYLANIRSSAELLGRQIDALAALARISQQAILLGPVAPRPLLQGVVEELMRLAPQRQVRWQLAEDFPQLYADATLLRQLFMALLDNALKFSGQRSSAEISVSWQALAGAQCSISVQDNGAGFASAQADQLFKVFARLHSVRDFAGLGLGLAQCRKIVDLLGGQIEITGAPDAGCCVTLRLASADKLPR